ncbi:MAG TPA: hypothetical protein VFJ28_07750 [Marmoricola sp.]|nr:hypothetical protein [Marmoricola sp.]
MEANLRSRRQACFEELRLAREWALVNVVDLAERADDPRCRPTPLGAVGLPVEEFAHAELAVSLQVHPLSARSLMADAVDIEARLPHVWSALAGCRLEVWVARKIATATGELTDERARWVDAAIGYLLGTLPPGRLLSVVEARVVEADQALAEAKAAKAAAQLTVWLGRENDHGVRALVARGDAAAMTQLYATTDHLARLLRAHGDTDPAMGIDELRAEALGLLAHPLAALKLLIGASDTGGPEHDHDVPAEVAAAITQAPPERTRPRAVVYLHLTPDTLDGHGVARAEEHGALTRRRLVDLLGHHHVTVRPVIDLNAGMAADCYEVPSRIAEQLHLARPADAFPYADSLVRTQDQDHTEPYQPHGPPDQTRLGNLGKLTRHHHRIKTHARGWRVSQREGRFTWTTPHGRVVVTDRNGNHWVNDPAELTAVERRLWDLALAG